MFGDGRQLRDMTYVSDAVAATVAAAERGQPGGIYNVASCAPRSLLEILGELERVARPGAARSSTRSARRATCATPGGASSAARRELGYEPATPLRGGLEQPGRRGRSPTRTALAAALAVARFIAEIGSNHNREPERCLDLVRRRRGQAGCKAVKLQLFRVEDLFAPRRSRASPELVARRAWELPARAAVPDSRAL